MGFAAALAAALLVAACEDTSPSGGGIGSPSPCTTIVLCQGRGTPTTTPLPPGDTVRFAYAANTTDNTISMFLVDDATGRLTPIGYVLAGSAPVATATDPLSQYVYVVNRDDDTVSAFEIDEHTGTLLEMDDSPYPTGNEPVALLIEPTGKSLYVANRTGSISLFTIDQNDGSLTPRTATSTPGRTPTSLAVDAAGAFLFVGNSEDGATQASVASFAIDSITGVLAPPNTIQVGDGTLSITLHPSGTFLYAVSDTAGDVAVLSVDDGSLAVVDASTASVGSGGIGIALSPSGASAYVINNVSAQIQDYDVDAGTGALTEISVSPLDTGTAPAGVLVDPLGERAYVMNAGSADVSVFSIDGTTGALASAGATRSRQGPQSLALVTRGNAASAKAKFAYILNQGASTISSYDVNASSGALTGNGPQSLTGGLGTARGLAVDPFARFVFVAHASNNVSSHRINASTGALPPIDTVSSGAAPSVTVSVDPTAITVEPSGRYAYAAGSSLNGATGWQVIVLAIDQTTGELTEVAASGLDVGTLPVSMTVDPTGRFLYTVDSGDDAVSMFTIAAATGLLTSVGAALAVDDDPRSVAVDGSGRLAYLVSAGTSQIQGFAIDAATGALTPIDSLTTGTNGGPSAVAADPTGRFVYAVNASINNIRPFVIDLDAADLGSLTSGTVSTTGSGPLALAVDPGGRFVYVVNQVAGSANIYSINQTSGNLSATGSIPSGALSAPIAIALTLLIE